MDQPFATGAPINLNNIPTEHAGQSVVLEELKPQVSKLDPKSRIGYHLARIVLAIISIFLIFLIFYILLQKPNNIPKIDLGSQGNLTDSTFNRNFRLIQLAQENNKASRDFIIQISQMVLLNMLLPILTAILGYIFGSHSETRD
ncbi:hypothetical protein [uncultured Mucilaginibacter sp.]|uniref:hypothetical protein n=1 Tax=uncultured Mucilaginibacter sp. TaxID=797541 RepID=UPI00262F5A36|nr:hypothetical protein [uncultured Mucilaginibacter sp.]